MDSGIVKVIEEEVKSMSVFLQSSLSGINGVSFREEQHLGDSRKEYVFELIVLKYANEDDYGPLLTIRLELKDLYEYELDLSVIRSFGEMLAQRILNYTEKTVSSLDIHQAFYDMVSALLIALKKEYLNMLD
ncbi:hypothetical protein [Chitinophaga sancti]|uniref:Uncharacterized protein n=1 Tax=Chitinophaga sancti TaxID=1004 RepID=A0A1K1SZL0_9BACT|nr:hypothetical protein [Chitinophaga sancti]WQD63631.1 hypothetical protein U0033_04430 [Chitinophaga sancti]WQG90744.1 hypothetical protein SR876_04490 [Chitinophaga sancti]SFW89684.1 hypothetical protein SAMN05661012_06476 [Chitinophaga sancti]